MKKSAGILAFRKINREVEFFLVHPGGPFWKNKHEGAWSIPKGEFSEEDPESAAKREFLEETGQSIEGSLLPLTPVKLKGGKMIFAFATEASIDETKIISNDFQLEWPYKSGKWITFPEIDKAGWFSIDEAKKLANPAYTLLFDELLGKL